MVRLEFDQDKEALAGAGCKLLACLAREKDLPWTMHACIDVSSVGRRVRLAGTGCGCVVSGSVDFGASLGLAWRCTRSSMHAMLALSCLLPVPADVVRACACTLLSGIRARMYRFMRELA